ncbi:MAG: hybrid sensor histidine kinase/response regulator [Luteolibacter sp.]|uniref:hybrid sensor histidine kinase/response regulator n=1 Tax=Luteolibacter sp. TaxID=1962973 RepID=UPI0032674976
MLDRLPHTDAPSLILVVDDDQQNIQMVGSLLLKHGHEVLAASSGPEALAKLEFAKPDMILLDVMMPGMTGFELCRILQARPETRDTPIIFLSDPCDKDVVIEALQYGGVDYVTKPFHSAELLTRVDLHSNLQKSRRLMSAIITEKNRLLEIVAHDLKNPLNGIQFAAIMLAEGAKGNSPEQDQLVGSIMDSSARAFEIVSNLLATPVLDELKTKIRNEPVCLNENAAKAVRGFEQHVRSKQIHLEFHNAPDAIMVLGEDKTLLCCFENLISNAIKFSPKGAHVAIKIQPDGGNGEFRIEDQGPGIREEEVGQLFQKFTRLSARPTAGEASTGLGLHIVHELVSAMQGTVLYEKSRLGGACFSVKLPLAFN